MLIKTDDLLSGKHGRTGHFVRFYDDSDTLLDEVASFVERALRARGRGIVIATGAHADALRRRLDELARAEGRSAPPSRDVTWLDAETTLSRVLVDGWPDRARFEYEVGRIVAEACAGGGPVHAFGDMMALLCARGRYDAALHLERLWNELARKLDFSLFCAYPWALFPSSDVAHVFRQVCAGHNHACADVAAPLPPGQPVDINLVRLEQKVQALHAEAARRREAERDLRRREREFADIVENAAEGLHQIGPDGTILWANKAELQMLGYRWEEYVGHHFARFHVDATAAADMLARLAAGNTVMDQPARLRCKDGSIRHVVIRANACVEDGRLRYTRCFTRDTTEQVRMQAELAAAARAQDAFLAMVGRALRAPRTERRLHRLARLVERRLRERGRGGLQYRFSQFEGRVVDNLRQQFIAFSVEAEVLKFGQFITKAGRQSPYFFNAGLFHDGATLGKLADFYAQTLLDSGLEFDMLFGPAYKGITLASATAVALAAKGRNTSFAYNRKEAKDHGEGGTIVGAKLAGKVVIIDDVISAGTSVRESVAMIRAAGAEPAAVLIALDRMERGGKDGVLSPLSAVQEVSQTYGIPVISIASLADLFGYLETDPSLAQYKDAVAAYRQQYGVA
ncbi:orotate phosphoribosyltransferase [Massilia sp. PDC64]|nr:orotate phosphoribosyltransferase [Massilia sp. PDC64]